MSNLRITKDGDMFAVRSDWRKIAPDTNQMLTRLCNDDCKHASAYECAHCGEHRCMACDEPTTTEQVKTAVQWCPAHREQGRLGMLARVTP